MRPFVWASTILLILATSSIAAPAIILSSIVTSRDVIRPHWEQVGNRYIGGHKRVRIFDRRKLGMLCVMPPDMQVALDWPGPACAYSDNFIFLPHRHRHMR